MLTRKTLLLAIVPIVANWTTSAAVAQNAGMNAGRSLPVATGAGGTDGSVPELAQHLQTRPQVGCAR
jgi:hypothetical protein